MTARRTIVLFTLSAIALGGSVARAQPALGPNTVTAIPRYATPPSILAQWNNVVGETHFEVYRSVNGGAAALVQTVAMDVLAWRDTAVNNIDNFTYTVRACDAGGCTAGTGNFTTSVTVVWPVASAGGGDTAHEVLHGFNEVIGAPGIRSADGMPAGFHDGVDLNRTTAAAANGNNVLAPMGGVVASVNVSAPADNDFIAVRVDVGPPVGNEFYSFSHIANGAATPMTVAMGDVVAPGQMLGNIGIRHFVPLTGDFSDHIHSDVTTALFSVSSIRHFLRIFTAAADLDPQGNSPRLFDENADMMHVFFRDHTDATLSHYLTYDPADVVEVVAEQKYDLTDAAPVGGDLDIHVEVTDQQGTNPRQAPVQLGYWIEGPRPAAIDLDDVRDAATPYMLYDFRGTGQAPAGTNYMGAAGAPGGIGSFCGRISDLQYPMANSGCQGGALDCVTRRTTACVSILKEGATHFPWPVLHHFIVTHARGTTGARNDVQLNQFWRTNAVDDSLPVTGAHANYSTQPATALPNQARFPDGEYNLHVIAQDFLNTSDLELKFRIENFTPMVKEMTAYVDKDDNAGSQVDADHPGCETELYRYKHDAPNTYPGGNYLAISQRPVFAPYDKKVCVKVIFSESMDTGWAGFQLNLDPQGNGAGAAATPFAGAFAKTYSDNDTWKGSLIFVQDASGNSDAAQGTPNLDAVLTVIARDLEDRAMVQRGMDANADGNPEGDSADRNHRIKIDAKDPETSITIQSN